MAERCFFRADEYRKEDAAINFARGLCAICKEIADLRLDRIRKLDTKCAGFQGCLIYHAVGVAMGRENHYLWRNGKGMEVAWA